MILLQLYEDNNYYFEHDLKLDYNCNTDSDCTPKKFREGCGENFACANLYSQSLNTSSQCTLDDIVGISKPSCKCSEGKCIDLWATSSDPIIIRSTSEKTYIVVDLKQTVNFTISFYNNDENDIIDTKPKIISCQNSGKEMIEEEILPQINTIEKTILSGNSGVFEVELQENNFEIGGYMCIVGFECISNNCPDWVEILNNKKYYGIKYFLLQVE